MAAFLELWNKRQQLVEAVCEACREAEDWREKEYNAAIKIQSWFRGCRVRAYLRYLNECAVIIQKTYRGHYGRRQYREYLKEYYDELQHQFYSHMATIIQSAWRGYYTRKYLFNYYAQKTYLAELKKKNEETRLILQEHKQKEIDRQLKREKELQEIMIRKKALQYHYMLSTESSPGVFKQRDTESVDQLEAQMRSIHYHNNSTASSLTASRRRLRQKHTSQPKRYWSKDESSGSLPAIDLTAADGDCRLRHTLPPINKPQGPFKLPKDVWQKRHSVLKPTLRTSTSYSSVEQARLELQDKEDQMIVVNEKFLPFTKSTFQYRHPVMASQTSYIRLAYGNEYFREKTQELNKQRFQSVVPGIALFDQI
ncbi:PREDICTED: spermatogenesis-associated protein 17-like [Amphimedon queenslandica]|uniref:Spermatogenesis-associated protein 17 n=1 Tax=Amphimedon queenslandica TaxID=400682 RepID=A0A1X7V530_AMPQE|nr:PREDICTED: spermatogenesis-associated protein 17-like [Amphimedon queenslandica]|eukprot:XP_011403289.1 PREDICTED: spermatogenesis-associated protein 17-like [Amphimedon queenslandica]